MWFRRAGELVAEVSTHKREAAAATALAAQATAEAMATKKEAEAARAEAAALSERCAQLEEAARHRNPEVEELLDAERHARIQAEAEVEHQKQRAASLRSQLDELSEALAQREREAHASREQNEAVLAAVRSCAQLDLPSEDAAPTEALAEEPAEAEEDDGTDGAEELKEVDGSEVVPPPRAAASLSARAGAPPVAMASSTLDVRDALGAMIRDVLGGELSHLVTELRSSAVSTAEAACDARVEVLERAVGELLGALDAESHRLLVKWKRQADDAQKEARTLHEQLRLQHVAHVDAQNELKKASRRAAEAEERARAEAAENAARARPWHAPPAARTAMPTPPPPPQPPAHTQQMPPMPHAHHHPPPWVQQPTSVAVPTSHPAGYWVLPSQHGHAHGLLWPQQPAHGRA